MTMHCPTCDKEYEANVAYCVVCGSKTEPMTAQEQPPHAAQSQPDEKVVSTGAYFGMMLLFSLPLIGFIACLLMCFIPQNKNIKNYAKAQLIWSIVSLIVTALLVLAVSTVLSAVMGYVGTLLPEAVGDVFGQLGGFSGLGELLNATDVDDLAVLLEDVDWSQVDLSQLQPVLEQLGVNDLSELQPLLDQLGVSDLNELQPVLEQLGVNDPSEIGTLIAQLDAQDLNDLNTVLEQMDVDNVSELVDVMNRYQIDSLDELAALANYN